MKKGTKIALLAAAALLIVGIVLCVVSFSSVGFRWSGLSNTDQNDTIRQTAQYVAAEFDAVEFHIDVDDLTVSRSPDNQIHLAYTDRKNLVYSIADAGGRLVLTQNTKNTKDSFWSNFQWFALDLSGEDKAVELLLPTDFAGDLAIYNDVGDVDVKDITLTGAFACELGTGEVRAERLRASSVTMKSAVGDMNGDAWTIAQYVSLSTGTGDISLEKSEIGSDLLVRTYVGSATLTRVSATTADLLSRTGDINLQALKIDRLTAVTEIGEVKGSIDGAQRAYTILTDADVGEVTVKDQKGTTDKEISITTDVGDIDLSFLQ